MTAVERDVPPSLVFHAPDCPICGEETNPVDRFFLCEACGCSWHENGDFHEWNDIDAQQCDATVRPWEKNDRIPEGVPYKHEEFRCLLDKGHEVEGFVKHAHPDVNGALWAKGWR